MTASATGSSAKRTYPSATRNAAPITACLREHLPKKGSVLEIASGSGQHIAGFAAAFPILAWQPSDPDETARASIAAWCAEVDLPNLAAPLDIDVMAEGWWHKVKLNSSLNEGADAIIATNMVHISPWAATLGLLNGAGELLNAGGILYLYGPYKLDGAHTAPSNAAFDADLRGRNPQWGIRDVMDLQTAARDHGLVLEDKIAMPANNFSLIFRKDT